MSANSEIFPPPNNPDDFESLCLDLWKDIWHNPGADKNGRSGQAQAGVDVYGQQDGQWMGVQCKQKDGQLRRKITVAELEREVVEALTFKPKLTRFILATTGPADAKVQQRTRELTEDHRTKGLFTVEVWSWNKIWHEIYAREALLRQIGPVYWQRHWKLIEERLRCAPAGSQDTKMLDRETLRGAAISALKEDVLCEFLAQRYPEHSLLHAGSMVYPVVVFPASAAQRTEVDSVLERPLLEVPVKESELVSDPAFREGMCGRNKKVNNRISFVMKQMTVGKSISIACQIGDFFQMLDTCDALEWEVCETMAKLKESKNLNLDALKANLKLRSELHRRVADPVIDGSLRAAGIGISTLIACYDESELFLLMRQRGTRSVAFHEGLMHVIPSCMFQPLTCNIRGEFSVRHNVYREYLEELFNRPEPEGGEADHRYFYGDERLLFLEQLLKEGKAQFLLTGIGVNLLSLRPEVCTLLFIKSSEWYRKHSQSNDSYWRFQLNEEWASAATHLRHPRLANWKIRFRETIEAQLNEGSLSPHDLTPAGAAAFWLGWNCLRELLGQTTTGINDVFDFETAPPPAGSGELFMEQTVARKVRRVRKR